MNDKDVWIKTKWIKLELDRKLVRFSIPYNGMRLEGIGEFLVKTNDEGLLAVRLRADLQATMADRTSLFYPLGQDELERIERLPQPSEADFSLSLP